MKIGTSEPVLTAAERDDLIRLALAGLDEEWMLRTLADAVNIPSPTGDERSFAEYLVEKMREQGLDSRLQPIDARSANAIGVLGDGSGPSVLVFAPLDSAFSGIESEEVPWSGPVLRADQIAVAQVQGDTVTGLSADNPKGNIVAAIAAAGAIARSGSPLAGRLVLAFGAGGAPSNRRPGNERWNVGHGSGCEFLLQQGVRADFAIVAKPGYAVQWEEVGLCWFRVRIHGRQSYVGRKHVLVDDNPILHAAKIIPLVEAWFAEYSRRHTDGLVAPQAAIGAIEGGWTRKPAFTPAACDLYIDMRISPRTEPMQVWRELQAALADIREGAGLAAVSMDCELIAAIEGPATPRDNWIIESCIRSWEAVEGRTHQPFLETSGQTEAVIFRRHGIPTARIGLPAQMSPLRDDAPRKQHSMGVVEVPAVHRLAQVLARTIVDTCTRPLAEVGLRVHR
jgi:succinyl-diaminopimelate desuccinylase